MKSKVLIIYTGGTIGMMQDAQTGQLRPFNFKHLSAQIPELNKFDVELSAKSFERPIDSSNMEPEIWIKIAGIIFDNYSIYDGFVVLHGSDTMAYTASALSFMLQNLNKPVVFTGSQLPIGTIRTDGKENIITAIEIAAAKENGKPVVPEVSIYFEYRLHRGNRTSKVSAAHFDAFSSGNYPLLAEAGVNIKYNSNFISKVTDRELTFRNNLNTNIAVLHLFPGITQEVVECTLNGPGLKGVVMLTFGSGNGPTKEWFIAALEKTVKRGVPVINVTQCHSGFVVQGKYETSSGFERIGVISGRDMTTEAAITKLMLLLGEGKDIEGVRHGFNESFCGEVSL